MKNERDRSLQIRLAALAMIILFIALGAAAYLSGWQVKRESEFVARDAVPGTIAAHKMRMAMSRSIGWVMVAASAQSNQSRDESLKIVHDADTAFSDAVNQYKSTIIINPAKDRALLEEATSQYAKFQRHRMAYEALILAGDRDGSAAFLERDLVPAYVEAIGSAEKLVDYNHANSIEYSSHIRDSVHQLYWAVAVVMALALICAGVLFMNLSIRRREVRELRESEELFRTSFESATVGVCLVATDGRFRRVNHTFCNMLGYAEEALLQLTFNDVSHKEDWEVGRTFLESAMAGGPKTMQIEKRYLHKSGRVVWAFLSTALIEPARGHGGYLISYIQDITDRKRAEAELQASEQRLRESESQFRRILENVSLMGVVLDRDSRITLCNDYLLATTGWKREEALHQNWFDLFIPSDVREKMRQEVSAIIVASGALPDHFENEIITRQGERRLIAWSNIVLRNEDGSINGVAGIGEDITDRRRLEQTQAELAAIVESSDDAIIGKTPAGIITSWNRGAEKIFGYAAAEALGKPLLMLFPVERRHEETEILARIGRGETVEHFDTVRVRKDGRQIDVSVTISPLLDTNGKVIGASKIARDISERKKADEKLRETESSMRALINAVQEALFLMTPDGRLTVVNEAVARRFGKPVGELIGTDIYDQIPEPLATRRRGYARQVMESGQPLRVEDRRGDLELETRFYPAKDATGKITHIALFSQDITERKKVETRLREQALLLDQAADAIMVTNFSNRITYWNRAAERLFGWKAAEAVGHTPEELFTDFPVAQVAEFHNIFAAHGQWSGEVVLRPRTGQPLTMDFGVTLALDAEGQPRGRMLVGTDITEKKKIQEQFLRVQRLESIGMLAAGITHDLGNVLAPIGMISHVLRETLKGEKEIKLLDILDEGTQRGANLISQILGFARGVGGEAISVQVKHLMHDINEMAKKTFPKSIKIESHIANDLWLIKCSPTQIHQILLNLCVNARDAMPDGGVLKLRAQNCELDREGAKAIQGARPGRWLVMQVADTGTGMSAETLARIWEPFFTTKPLDKGTGLGLPTIRGIVETLQGFITVDTEPGKGTTFRVYLPAAEAPLEAQTSETSEALILGTGQRILVVDDEAAIRNAVSAALSSSGYYVNTVANGAEAVVALEKSADEYALVITDFDMPVMNGAQLGAWVRSFRPGIRILQTSGLGSDAPSRVDKSANIFDAYLLKPFTSQALLKVVDQLLNGSPI